MSDETIIINLPPRPTKKATKLRVIDQGNTRYDVAGKLIQLGRAIRDGKFGKVSDVVIGVRQIHGADRLEIHTYHFGSGDIHIADMTIERMKRAMGR